MSAVNEAHGIAGPRRASWLGVRWLRVAAGILTVLSAARAAPIADKQAEQRPAPHASWVEFAGRLQQQFQRELSADNKRTARFTDAMTRLLQASDRPPRSVVVRAWVTTEGKVERLELEGRQSEEALHDLYAVLGGSSVGVSPPDMPQPLRMRLSLKPRPEQ
jgi:hypothetical protein